MLMFELVGIRKPQAIRIEGSPWPPGLAEAFELAVSCWWSGDRLPLVPSLPLPEALAGPHRAFVVGLVASPERIATPRPTRTSPSQNVVLY